jgi:DNA-binding transcriptional LysR family regulator
MLASDRIGRRIKLRDLHVLMSVAQTGSMSKAAKMLNTTQSAVSRSIAELESAVGLRLLDRTSRGVAPTPYGRALLDGGAAVFDDLRQAVRNIEFLSDPTLGHIKVGANEATVAGLIPAVFGRLRQRHPGISIHVTPVLAPEQQYRALRERELDLVVGRVPSPAEEDIHADILFHDHMIVVAGSENAWARRRKVDLRDIADEPWSVPPPDIPAGALVADAFRTCGLRFPPRGAAMGSVHLFSTLVAGGPFLGIFPASLLRLNPNLPPLRQVAVRLPIAPWPVGAMTLRNRTLSPVTQLFVDCARELVQPLTRPRPV